jgi:hypothetical protein
MEPALIAMQVSASDAATSSQCVVSFGVEHPHAEFVSMDCSSVLALQFCDSVRCIAEDARTKITKTKIARSSKAKAIPLGSQ